MGHQPSMPSSDSLGRATQKASEFVFSRSPMILLLSSICFFFAGFLYMFFCLKNMYVLYDMILFHHQSHHFFNMSGALPHLSRLFFSIAMAMADQDWDLSREAPCRRALDMAPCKNAWFEQDWFENRQKSSIYDGKIHDCPIDVQLFNQKNNCWFD